MSPRAPPPCSASGSPHPARSRARLRTRQATRSARLVGRDADQPLEPIALAPHLAERPVPPCARRCRTSRAGRCRPVGRVAARVILAHRRDVGVRPGHAQPVVARPPDGGRAPAPVPAVRPVRDVRRVDLCTTPMAPTASTRTAPHPSDPRRRTSPTPRARRWGSRGGAEACGAARARCRTPPGTPRRRADAHELAVVVVAKGHAWLVARGRDLAQVWLL